MLWLFKVRRKLKKNMLQLSVLQKSYYITHCKLKKMSNIRPTFAPQVISVFQSTVALIGPVVAYNGPLVQYKHNL